MEKRTVLRMLRDATVKYNNCPYSSEKGDNGYVSKTFNQVHEDALALGAELSKLGLQKNDKIALLAEGRTSWVVSEYGILAAACVAVPLSIKLLPEEILFRLNHSESKAILVSHNLFEKVASIWKKIHTKNFKIIYLDNDLEFFKTAAHNFGIDIEKDVILFDSLIQKGKRHFEKSKAITDEIEKTVQEDDVVTISYSSGTTGDPKGVMLTHLNYFSNSTDAMEYFNVTTYDRLMIILPLDHSFAHTVGIYASLVRGLSIYFVDARGGGMATLKNIPINIKEANPHFMLTVPALSGNFMAKMQEGIAAKGGFVKWLFDKGLQAGITINGDGFRKAGIFTKLVNIIPYKLADALIFSKLRKVFGDNFRYCVGGGALLDVKQQRFFYAIGVPVYQGYGLTEATPIISTNTPKVHKLGTSGKVVPTVNCRILKTDGTKADVGEKGEIVIQGENVMKGYYKNPSSTEKTVKGGWLYTGDMGYLDKDGFLMVVGREKALLISSDGEKYSPEGIEEAIINCSEGWISQVMLYNDHSKYTVALITLNIPKVQAFIRHRKIADAEILLKEIKRIFYRFKTESEYQNQFPEKWIPSAFRILVEPFTEENKMINSTMKMVRYKITETYIDTINDIFVREGDKIVNDVNIEAVKRLLPFH